jgi:outer membrane protein OmpA-like peptidoglycan-associated protein
MAEDWSIDVRKYAPDADSGVIAAIVRYCGIALQSRDSSLVAFSDKTETDRVRENYLKKKLGLTEPDETLDSAIAAVGERMKGDPTKNRVTVYYLLAEHFGKLGLFGAADATGDGVAGAAALGAAGLAGGAALGAASTPTPDPVVRSVPPVTPASTPAYGLADVPEPSSGIGRWLPWLLLAAGVVALLWYLFGHRPAEAPPTATVEATAPAAPADEASPLPTPTTEAVAAIPEGAGVTTEMRNGKPAVLVYFDTGKAEVAPAFGPAAVALKTYLDANPGSRVAVSGFNDKTGNAALNAELSKNRAKAVKAALVASNIPEDVIDLEKPADTTDTATSDAQARRVEVVIK